MNLKWKRVFSTLLIGVGIAVTSCTSEIVTQNTGPEEEEGGDAYFAFQLTSAPNAISTRATDYGNKEEYVVNNAYVVFYDATDMQVIHQKALQISNGDGSEAFTGSGVATNNVTPHRKDFVTIKAQKLKKRDYKMLVILNAKTAMIDATVPGKRYVEFEKAYEQSLADVSENGSYRENGTGYKTEVTMTNADGLASVVKADFEETEDAAEAKTDLPKVKVDRVLAKVEFTKNADNAAGMYPNGGVLGDTRWILDITNRYTFWVRKFAQTAPSNGGSANGSAGPMENDPSVPRELRYAIDPNWDNISKLRTATGTPVYDPITDQFNVYYKEDITDQSPLLGLESAPTRVYALENTMAAADQWEDVTTRIVMKSNFRPVVYGQSTPLAANNSYYYYQGAAFTHAQITSMIKNTLPWPTSPAGLEAVVKSGTTQTDLYLNQTSIPTSAVSKTSADGKLTFYKDGISYYAIKIRHFDDTQSAGYMNYGRFGIVRNNVYKVTLSKVAGPGKPDIPKPEGPDDEEEGYVSATIEVNEWVLRKQNGEV